ncbi:MAG: rhodanese-like domain-containing protein, partial [Chloroflexota bacterium]|nr:rhodanese-like domain-containing protein [Chloroflexota bacterium]
MSKKEKKSSVQNHQIWTRIGLAAISLLVVAGIVFGMSGCKKTLPPEISVVEAHQKYQEGTFLLDVRVQEEWDQAHVPGATLIPLDELPNRIDEVPADQEIIVICYSGNRSSVGRDILLDAGFKQVTISKGGLIAWSAAGYSLEIQP